MYTRRRSVACYIFIWEHVISGEYEFDLKKVRKFCGIHITMFDVAGI